MRLGAIFYNDFELLDAYGPLEMFGALGDEIEIVTIAEQAGPVSSSAGPKTIADYGFDDAPELDLILLPGGIGTINNSTVRVLQFYIGFLPCRHNRRYFPLYKKLAGIIFHHFHIDRPRLIGDHPATDQQCESKKSRAHYSVSI